MRRVLVNNTAAVCLHELRETEDFMIKKDEVANAMEYVSNLIHYSRDGEPIDTHVDELLFVLHTLAEYNSLLTCLNKPNDLESVYFKSSRDPLDNDDNMPDGEYCLDYKQMTDVCEMLKIKGVNLDKNDAQEMTFAECAKLAGMSIPEMNQALLCYRRGKDE